MAALEEMSIKLDGIGHALSDNKLTVPTYQRSYAWEDKHVSNLYSDLEKAINDKEQEYFLGSIVVIKKNNSDQLEVVDGQQRLASITILIAAIRDHFYNTDDKEQAADIEREFLTKKDRRTREVIPQLTLNESDHDYFSKRILSRPDDSSRKNLHTPQKESHKRIAIAADLAEKEISRLIKTTNKPTDKLNDWLDYISKNLRIILVKVADDANAFIIFETLNDRGLDLAISDLLKNYLFGLAQDRIAEVQQRWIKMFGTLEAVESEGMAVTYIRHLWSSEYGLTRERELYNKIKENIVNKSSAVSFSNSLSNNARLYAAIINPDHEFWNKYGPTTRQHMATINLLRMIQIRPLILAIIDKFSINDVQGSLKLIVSWAVRLLIVGGLGGGVLESNYCDRAKKIREGEIKTTKDLIESMVGVIPNDSQFKSSFSVASVSKNYLARYYLRVLEKVAIGEDQPELVPNPNEDEVNLEHILPQNPSEDWDYLDPELIKVYCKRLGNMALMKTKMNEEQGDKGFSHKSPLYKISNFKLTSSLSLYSEWGPEQIEKRQEELANLAVEAWPYKV